MEATLAQTVFFNLSKKNKQTTEEKKWDSLYTILGELRIHREFMMRTIQFFSPQWRVNEIYRNPDGRNLVILYDN
jgi:hypothetical protein